MTQIDPIITPTPDSLAQAAEVKELGGDLTAEDIEFLKHYRFVGVSNSRADALQQAGADGALRTSPSGLWAWEIYTPKEKK